MVFVMQAMGAGYPPAVDKRAVRAIQIPDHNCVVGLLIINLGVPTRGSLILKDNVIVRPPPESIPPWLQHMLAAVFITGLDY